MTIFISLLLFTVFISLWLMYRNNEDIIKPYKVGYITIPTYEMNKITINYITAIVMITLFLNTIYLFRVVWMII